jgi:hypothetical protein
MGDKFSGTKIQNRRDPHQNYKPWFIPTVKNITGQRQERVSYVNAFPGKRKKVVEKQYQRKEVEHKDMG